MKKAFTMIELIFVIVILGILAAVALPKFLGVAGQAHEANLKAFVGTLNRSVGPTLWSKTISGYQNDGNISQLGSSELGSINAFKKYTDIPKEIANLDLTKCDDPNSYKIVAYANKNKAGGNYFIACKDGNANQSPKFVLYKQTSPATELTASNLGDYNTTNVEDTNTTDTYSGGETGELLK